MRKHASRFYRNSNDPSWAERHHQTHVRRRSPIRGRLLRESAVAPQGMTAQGLECRAAVLSWNHAEAVKSPQHQAKIVPAIDQGEDFQAEKPSGGGLSGLGRLIDFQQA